MPITCYAVGQALEKNPAVAKALQDGGHEIASHAYRWIDYHSMPAEQEKEYILRQLKSIKALTGEYPCGWYYGRLSPRSKVRIPWVLYSLQSAGGRRNGCGWFGRLENHPNALTGDPYRIVHTLANILPDDV